MVKRPDRSPHGQRFQRTPQRHTVPETARPAAVRKPTKKPSAAESARDALQRGLHKLFDVLKARWNSLSALACRLIRKMLLRKDVPRATQRAFAVRRLRFAIYAGSAAVVTVVLLLVLLAPGGAAAPASEPSGSATPAPIATTAPDPVNIPFPTTAPDPSVTQAPATPTPRPTATPTQRPTATASPTQRPTATASPTPRPTATAAQTTSSGGTDMASMASYFVVSADTYYNEVGYSTNHYSYTEEELYMLARVMQTEAGGTANSMIAVGNVVINRVLCGRFGSTITAVVTSPNQFSYNPSATPKPSALSAAHAVLDDEVWLVPQNTYYFKGSGTEGEAWGSHPYCTCIGGNYFYTHDYSGRYNGDSIPPALFNRTYKHAQYGCKPEDRVYRIQYMLQSLGYSVSPDRYFGQGTREALIAFQQSMGLTADGVAGPATVEALINAFGVENYRAQFLS